MTRVLIAAATPTLRAGLRAILSASHTQIVGEVAGLAGLAPDTLADVDVGVLAGAELLAESVPLAALPLSPALVVLSDDVQVAATLQAMPLRGWGLVAPDAPAAELQAAVAAAAQGMVVLPQALARQLLAPTPAAATTDVEPLDEPLTAREHEVLQLLSQGLPNKLIAQTLEISEHTVKFHVSSIYAKLGASSRTDAISRGARRGLVTL